MRSRPAVRSGTATGSASRWRRTGVGAGCWTPRTGTTGPWRRRR
jgi:hypothetical protein